MYRAQEVGPDHKLSVVTRRLATQAGLPMPKVYVIPDMSPNAFATGRNPSHAAVAATEGILQLLDDSGAGGRHRTRARAREAPRHPDQLGGRDRGGRDHDGGAHGAVRRVLWRRQQPRRAGRVEPDRDARDDHLRADGRGAGSGGDFAVARVSCRCGWRQNRGLALWPDERAAQARGGIEADSARRESGDVAHVHREAVLRWRAAEHVQHAPVDGAADSSADESAASRKAQVGSPQSKGSSGNRPCASRLAASASRLACHPRPAASHGISSAASSPCRALPSRTPRARTRRDRASGTSSPGRGSASPGSS